MLSNGQKQPFALYSASLALNVMDVRKSYKPIRAPCCFINNFPTLEVMIETTETQKRLSVKVYCSNEKSLSMADERCIQEGV